MVGGGGGGGGVVVDLDGREYTYMHKIHNFELYTFLFILTDYKAIISKGKLRCAGSSLFLKSRFGIGYYLG